MEVVLQQHPQHLQVYQQGADNLASTASAAQTSKVLGKGDVSQSRAAWFEAVEDKENVDPASGLTVATRRQRRRTAAGPASTEMPADLDTLAGPGSKGIRQPLTDITPAFPEATVCYTSNLPEKPALTSEFSAGLHQSPGVVSLMASVGSC